MYKLMLLIKGDGAVQLLKGLAVLLIATALSSLFNLVHHELALKTGNDSLVVALPVVFQPNSGVPWKDWAGDSF